MIKAIFNFFLAWLVLFSSIGFAVYQVQRPGFIGTQSRDVRLYERLSGELGSLLPTDAKKNIPFTDAEIKDIVTTTIDANTFYDIETKVTDTYTGYLTSRSDSLNFTYPLATIKTNLQTAITNAMVAQYASEPTCKTTQLKGWQATNGIPACQLPTNNILSTQVNTLFAQQAASVANQLPDSWTLSQPNDGLVKQRGYVTEGVKIIELIWAATFGFILLYLLIFRSRAFLSLAFIFLLAGLLEVGFSYIGWDWLGRTISDSLTTMNQATAGAITDLVAAVLDIMKTILGNLSIITLSAGGLSLILGIFYKFKKVSDIAAK